MDRRGTSRLLALALALWGWSPTTADAAPPWAKLLTFHRVEADPDQTYPVTEDNGPWMIVACSFSGDGAEEQAQDLVYELRKRYKLPAYTAREKFEFGTTQARGIYGTPLRMKHRHESIEEVAVLVGNYPAIDDPEAQKILQRLKNTHPRSLDKDRREKTNQSLAGWRWLFQEKILASGSKHKKMGPMGRAFITTNPLLPKDYFTTPGDEPLVVEMNEHVTHSLLDCPGKYTVQVATFRGKSFVKPREIEAVENGRPMESRLVEAARKAHRLTEALRDKGWEAYEFHDRHASLVTVGSFNSVGTPRADGRIEIDPRIHAIMQTFGAQQSPGLPNGVTPLKSVIGIPLDAQPIPVKVPKRSIGHEMAARR